MKDKLFDSELKVMQVLWRRNEDLTAKEIAAELAGSIGWNKNTTYTVIKKCVEKGAIARTEPNFICHALIEKQEVQRRAASELVDRIFDGSATLLFASLLHEKTLSREEIDKLKQIVDSLK